jgi:hypothetical protein
MAMSDSRDDQSEHLDGDVLGENIGDDDRPGVDDYPPDEPFGVEDPSLLADDDLATRRLRRDLGESVADEVPLLGDPDPTDTFDGDVLHAAHDEGVASRESLPAEEAAMHIEDGPAGGEPAADL